MAIYIPPTLYRMMSRPLGRWMFSPRASWPVQRRRFERTMAEPGLPRYVTVGSTKLGGVLTELLTPQRIEPGRVLLFLHGGGFMLGSPRSHRALAGRLAVALHAVAYVPDYRLAPEHPFPAAFDDTIAAYRALLSTGVPATDVIVAGDSTGAGLALALGVEAVRCGLPLPSAIGLMCPSMDFTPEAAAQLPRDRREPIMNAALVQRFWDAYFDIEQRRDIRASPLLADPTGLPPLVIDTAEYDSLSSQARRLADKAQNAGLAVYYREHPGLPHGFHSAAGLLKQADNAIDKIGASLLRARTNQSS